MPELVNCPHCAKKLRVPDNLIGRTVKCPTCQKPFTATAMGPAPPPEEEPAPRSSGRRPADEEDRFEEAPRRRRPVEEEDEEERPRRRPRDEDEDEDEDRPRRRRSRIEDDDEDDEDDRPRRRKRRRRSRADAEGRVKGPGVVLLICGILGLLAGGFYLIQAIIGRPLLAPQGGPQPVGAEAAGFAAGLWAVALVSLIWGAVVTLGGVKMLQLQSRSSCMVASIFAMLPCNPCCLLGLPIGIWALVVLSNEDVKDAFV